MLYAIKGTKYQGNIFNDNSKAFRDSLKAEGYTVAWFDEEPDFHKKWVNTPAKPDKFEIEISLKLSDLKEIKNENLSYLSHKFDNNLVETDMFVISSLGFKVNADIRSQNNIKGLIAVNADTVDFVDYNNEIHKLTPSDLNILLVECSKNGENLYKQKWAYVEKIKACKTIAELEKIDFNFVMLDFTNATNEVLS